MFVPTNMVLKRYLACQTFSKCQPYSNESCLSLGTYTYKIEVDNQLNNCLWNAVYQRCRCYKYTYRTCKITVEKNDRVAIALMILHHNIKEYYSKSI